MHNDIQNFIARLLTITPSSFTFINIYMLDAVNKCVF